jgi:hypothetical protein
VGWIDGFILTSIFFISSFLSLKMYKIQWISPLTPNNLQRRHAVGPLKFKIPSKNMHEKPTNATIIHSVY